MPGETTGALRPPTGGTTTARVHGKQWWVKLATRVEQVLSNIVAEEAMERRPAAAVAGADAATWAAWLAARDVIVDRDRVDLAMIVDALSSTSPGEARDLLNEVFERTSVGGRLLLVERVVPLAGRTVFGLHDLLQVVVNATGGAVTLRDATSLQRPGTLGRSTVVLELVRLAIPGD